MVDRITRIWLVTATLTAGACVIFGIAFYPRGPSDEVKFTRAATRDRAMTLLGGVYPAIHERRYEDAAAIAREALAIDPDLSHAHYALGTALARLRDFEGAEAAFARSLELKKGFAHPLNSLGAAQWAQGEFDEAERNFREARRVDPQDPTPAANLGLSLLREGKNEEARQAFDEVIAKLANPSQGAPVYEARGIARALSGDTKGAIEDLSTARDSMLTKAQVLRVLANRARARDAAGDGAGVQADRDEYARLEQLPENDEGFTRPLKDVTIPTKEGTPSNGL